MFRLLIILFLVALSGCYTYVEAPFEEDDFRLPQDESSENVDEISFEVKSKQFNSLQASVFDFPREPKITVMASFEEYQTVYPGATDFDETFFETQGLIHYVGLATDVMTMHEIVGLTFEDGRIILHARIKLPEVVIALYVERPFFYEITFVKPTNYSEVTLEVIEQIQHQDYYLDQPSDYASVINRIHQNDYINASLRIVFDFDTWLVEENSWIDQKMAQYDLDSYQGTLTKSNATIVLSYNRLSQADVEKIILLFDDDDVDFIIVGITNFNW